MTRIDKAEAVKHNWFAVKGSQTVYSLGSQKAHFEKMVRGKHLVIRVFDPSGQYTRFFDLDGLEVEAQKFECSNEALE